MSEQQEQKTFEADGTRPIESGAIEVADTFSEDGTRPIAESPDFLITDSQNNTSDRPVATGDLDTDQVLEVDGKSHVNNSEVKVVDTFEADGTRPIMSNKYEVVDTLDIDGERPITSK
ncbi:MAG: hypothetical protein AAGE84_15405 [Cyanobacteria bacterium P01_G01_bin.39]